MKQFSCKELNCKNKNLKIAYISDLHGFNKINEITSLIKKQKNISLIVLGGDFTDYTIPGTLKIVKAFMKLELNTLLIPGSHENFEVYDKLFDKIKNKKLIDGYKHNHLKLGTYELIIISGSSTVVTGIPNMRGGTYWQIEQGVNKKEVQKKVNIELKKRRIARKGTLVFMDDIVKKIETNQSITPPSTKLILSHNPPKCKTTKGIDLAKFGIVTTTFTIKKEDIKKQEFKELDKEEIFEKDSVLTIDEVKSLKKYGYPVKIIWENVGSKEITNIMKKYEISKIICGHIHEAGPRAINKKEKKVAENEWTKDLRINSGEGSKGLFTIAELEPSGKIKYQFIKATTSK